MSDNQSQSAAPWADRHLWQLKPVRDLVWIAMISGVIVFGYYLQSVILPVLIAMALAYVVNPLIDFARRYLRMPRVLTVMLVMMGGVLFIVLFSCWLGPIIYQQTTNLVVKLKPYKEVLLKQFESDSWMQGVINSSIDGVNQFLRDSGYDPQNLIDNREQLAQTAQSYFGTAVKSLYTAVKAVFKGTSGALGFIGDVFGLMLYLAVSGVLIPIYFFFFSWRFDNIFRGWEQYIPKSQRERVVGLIKRMDAAFNNFFRGRLLIAMILGTFFSVGWWLAGVPYWLLLGMITGVLNIIPFASGIGWPFAMLFKYLDVLSGPEEFTWLAVVVWPTVVFQGGQFIEGWILTPYIQSKTNDLSAVTIIIVMMIGGSLAGLYGLLLAIPIASCIKILLYDVVFDELKQWAEEN